MKNFPNINRSVHHRIWRVKYYLGKIIRTYDFSFSRFNDEFGKRDLDSITSDEILSLLTRLTEGTKQTTKRIRY